MNSRSRGTGLSEDGGENFKASNIGVGAGFTPDQYPEFGQRLTAMVPNASKPVAAVCTGMSLFAG